jgi:hypothetical protein
MSLIIFSDAVWRVCDFCLVFVPLGHYDEPEIVSYTIMLICPIGADVRRQPRGAEKPFGSCAVERVTRHIFACPRGRPTQIGIGDSNGRFLDNPLCDRAEARENPMRLCAELISDRIELSDKLNVLCGWLPRCKDYFRRRDLVRYSLVSGLLLRCILTAGPDGIRGSGPYLLCGFEHPGH